jgi:DMSO/TMAO reductase YedYZ molybdopterin-dependent catalytic subunit
MVHRAADSESAGRPVGRRIVLGMLGLGAVGVVAGARVQRAAESVLGPLGNSDPTGLTGLLPAAGGFRYYSVTGANPVRTEADYRLAVTGLVARPAAHTLAALRAMPQTALVRDFQCVTGWRVPAVPWSGVLLSRLIQAAGPRPEARAVLFRSFDGAYTESLTLEQASRDDVFVALTMYGKPVTRAHGGPVRLYVVPMYGYKSCKWLGEIELTARVTPGYWELRGYDADAWTGGSNGRDDEPT